MLNGLESIDLFEKEFDIDKIYNLMKTPSSSLNLEIFSKIQNIATSHEYFSQYTNIEINSLLDSFKKLEDNFLDICNNENYLKFKSNSEKYISIFSNLILLFNFILKIRKIVKTLLNKIKNNIIKYYSENQIDVETHDKINDYINSILSMPLIENEVKRISFNSFVKESRSTANITNTSIYSINKDKFNVDDNDQNNLYEPEHEENIITPYFISRGESYINNNELLNNNNYNLNLIDCKKKDSVGSIINLPCNYFLNDKNNLNMKENKKSIPNDDKYEILNKINLNNNPQEIINNNKINKSNSSHLNIYKVLLKNINELYKKRNITSPQKVKLKQLIVSRSSKLENLYFSYCSNNKNKFIDDLKKLL